LASVLSPFSAPTLTRSRIYRRAQMFEPILGLAVAFALGVYLLVTLLRPERF
jgi:K+-transporting ATPase KdpF subunit